MGEPAREYQEYQARVSRVSSESIKSIKRDRERERVVSEYQEREFIKRGREGGKCAQRREYQKRVPRESFMREYQESTKRVSGGEYQERVHRISSEKCDSA